MKNCIFIVSPYHNKNKRNHQKNIDYAKLCLINSIKNNESAYVSHLLYPQVLNNKNNIERDLSIEDGLEWIYRSDYIVCYVDRGITKGMRKCILYAELIIKPIVYRRLNSPNKLFILVSGVRGIGKSKIANIIKNNIFFNTVCIKKFSTLIKQDFCSYKNIPYEYYNKKKHKKETESFVKNKLKTKGYFYYLDKLLGQALENGITIIADNRYSIICDYFIEKYRENTILIKVNGLNTYNVEKDHGIDLDNYDECDVEIDSNDHIANLDNQIKNIVNMFLLNKKQIMC